MSKRPALVLALAVLALVAACSRSPQEGGQSAAAKPTPAEAKQFVARVNRHLAGLARYDSRAQWVKSTYITDDTEALAARADDAYLAYLSKAVKEAQKYADVDGLDSDTRRQLKLLKLNVPAPAPDDPEKRHELTTIAARMEGMYGKGKYCTDPDKPETCKTLNDLTRIMAESRDYDTLLDAWTGWRTVSPPMRDDYTRFVTLANQGARSLGYSDLSEMWKDGYDMDPAAFERDTDHLWKQVKPLYTQLQCYVRGRLADHYGERHFSDGMIPAHLLGNMWAQEWANIYPLVEPYPDTAQVNVTAGLKAQNYDARRMVKSAENYYQSMDLGTLPDTFWQRSMLTKPRDREVVCHASAWDLNPATNDVRIKVCLEPISEDLFTVYHELGHIYYYLHYNNLPYLYQSGANDGFHEAIGDTIRLSMTPEYLHEVGLIPQPTESHEAVINRQMQLALDKVAFLPFGKLIDQWRWEVFSGRVKPDEYNQAWWKLREQYQGVKPPVKRSEQDFDPGAKYHIASNTPYMRYFLADILQFQFYRALCDAAGHKGPLYTCTLYKSKAAGEKFAAMLKLGASRPWPEALEKLTGKREMDASAIMDYFQPLETWLEEQNKGQQCGW